MSYHKFPNLRETFQSDMTKKIMKGVVSQDFIMRDCNCNDATKIDGICIYGGGCRNAVVIYNATCNICDMVYKGNTLGVPKLPN